MRWRGTAPVNDILAELFSSKVRAAVLGHMLPRPHLGFSLTDLSRILNLPISSLQHECYKLERIGVLRARRDGNARRYRVNPAWPLRRELTALVVAAIGQDAALRATLQGVPGLEAAFLARHLPLNAADSEGTAVAPIPLVLIGEVPLEHIDDAQQRVASILGLPPSRIEAVFYRTGDWRSRLEQRSPYAVWLISGPRTDLLGQPASDFALVRVSR
jgi:DNA-binding transcriptional ArsR family regulator